MATTETPTTAIVHYTAPPIVGGVEAVIQAHASAFVRAGYPVTVVAGRGHAEALPHGADLIQIPLIDSQHKRILELSSKLERGEVPADYDEVVEHLVSELGPKLADFDNVIIHNVLTKHYNLPLTEALAHLAKTGKIRHGIAWCHDFTWTSPRSGSKVYPGHPWDLLRTRLPGMTYVTVSKERRDELAGLLACPAEEIRVVYNGVDPRTLLRLSPEGQELIERLELLAQDLVMLMPVRVTRAKNIEFALRVVAALKDQCQQLKLVLTGPPDPHDAESMGYFQELQSLRRDLGVEEEMRFVFESGPHPGESHTIDMEVVADLFRVCDLVFMPSHQEGFGMPVLEAGLSGVPVVCTDVPAAVEIGGDDVMLIDAGSDPSQVADRISNEIQTRPVQSLRRRVRQRYTWSAIFKEDIRPLLMDAQS